MEQLKKDKIKKQKKYHKNDFRRSLEFWLVVALSSALFITFISPQVGLRGRGLRSSLPLFLLLISVSLFLRGKDVVESLRRQFFSFLFGITFVFMAIIRYVFEPNFIFLQNHGIAALVCVGMFASITILRNVFPETVEFVRWVCLLALGISLGVGIPYLIREPGIARLTMGNPLQDIYAAQFFPKGVANYSWYTPVAISFPAIANWLINTKAHLIKKIVGWVGLLAASIAVINSTFTMAMVLLIVGLVSWLFLLALTGRNQFARISAGVVLILSLLIFPLAYYFLSSFEATQFQVKKATQIITGAVEVGILDADPSGRTYMFVDTMKTFFKYPILGAWGLANNTYFVGGHSSWADTLALHGLFGLILWLLFLLPSLKRGRSPLSLKNGKGSGTLSWTLLFVGGILNPTFFGALGLLLIWLYDDGVLWQIPKR